MFCGKSSTSNKLYTSKHTREDYTQCLFWELQKFAHHTLQQQAMWIGFFFMCRVKHYVEGITKIKGTQGNS